MDIFVVAIEHPLDMMVQRFHDPDPRHHRRAAARHWHQNLDAVLPFRQIEFLFRQAGDVVGCVTKRDERLAAGQRYRILEFALPACTSHVSPWTSQSLELEVRLG